MSTLEELLPNASVRGILPDSLITVVNVQRFGSDALELTYKSADGKVANELLYRHDEARIEMVELGRPWSFDGDGALFRLGSEAQRIRLAHLFDPVLAVHTSGPGGWLKPHPLPAEAVPARARLWGHQRQLRFSRAPGTGRGASVRSGIDERTK
jgi:hypothetical protein